MSELDEVLADFGSSLYDYITEKDIIKAAEVYAEKPMYKEAKQRIKALVAQTMSKAWLALENDEKDVYIYRDVLSTMIDEL